MPADCTGTAVPVTQENSDNPSATSGQDDKLSSCPSFGGWPEAVSRPSTFVDAYNALQACGYEIAELPEGYDLPDDFSDRHTLALAACMETPALDMHAVRLKLDAYYNEFCHRRRGAERQFWDGYRLHPDAAVRRILDDLEALDAEPDLCTDLAALRVRLHAAHEYWNFVAHQPDPISVPAGDDHSAVVHAIGDYRPQTLAELQSKLTLLRSPEAEGALDEVEPGSYVGKLLHDIARLNRGDEENCPAARLMDEHEPVYAQVQFNAERPLGEPEGAIFKVHDAYVDRASWARATSLRGAMYQLAMAQSRADFIDGAGNTTDLDTELRRNLDHRALDRLITSAFEAIRLHCGLELSNMMEAFVGRSVERSSELLADPPAFDVYNFVKDFEVAGGQLCRLRDGQFNNKLQIVPPDRAGMGLFFKLGNDAFVMQCVREYVFERADAEEYFARVARDGRA